MKQTLFSTFILLMALLADRGVRGLAVGLAADGHRDGAADAELHGVALDPAFVASRCHVAFDVADLEVDSHWVSLCVDVRSGQAGDRGDVRWGLFRSMVPGSPTGASWPSYGSLTPSQGPFGGQTYGQNRRSRAIALRSNA